MAPAANETMATPHPMPITTGSMEEPPENRLLSPRPWLESNLIPAIGIAVNFLTLVVLILTLRSYNVSNVTTQNALDFNRKTWQLSKLPFLGVEKTMIENFPQTQVARFSYEVVNDTDNGAVIVSYGIQITNLPQSMPGITLEGNQKDWLPPHSRRPRTEILAATPGNLTATDLYNNIIKGQSEIQLTIQAQDIFGDPITFMYNHVYRNGVFVITRAEVLGLPTSP